MATNTQNIFEKAIYDENTQLIRRLLLNPDIDPAANNQYGFTYAYTYGKTDVVRILLADPRIDPSVNNQEALRSACTRGNTEIVRLLLAHPRVDPSADEQDAIRSAIKNGHTEIVRLLLADPRVDPYVDDEDLTMEIACNGLHYEVVRLLLEDPRINPRINEKKAYILRTNQTIDFPKMIYQHKNDFQQLLVSVDHALEKELLKTTAKGLVKLQTFEKHEEMNPNVINTMTTFAGPRNHRNTITNSLYKLKGNYYGPTRDNKKRTQKNKSSK